MAGLAAGMLLLMVIIKSPSRKPDQTVSTKKTVAEARRLSL